MINIYGRLGKEQIRGVKKMSCLVAAKHFDIIHGFAIDYMHCVLLGVMKKLFNLWLDSKNGRKEYHIKLKDQVLLSNRLVNIKPISEIMRKPKSIFKRGEYKANEYRNMLIFYLWFALPGLLKMPYVEHFRLLSSAIYILLAKEGKRQDIERAEFKLMEFVTKFENLYGKENVTMNIHLLKHLAMNVKKLGPLWSHSMFGFEANNGVIIKANTSKEIILQQLVWKYSMRQTIPTTRKDDDLSISGKKTSRLTPEEKMCIFDFFPHLPKNDLLTVYHNVVIRGIKFTSKKSKEISTIDYFVSVNTEIVCVYFYFVIDSIIYALGEKYEVITKHEHFTEIIPAKTLKIVKILDVTEKLFFLKIGIKMFVASLPNRFEKV